MPRGEDAAFQITPEFPFHVGRHPLPVPVIFPCEREVGLQVLTSGTGEEGGGADGLRLVLDTAEDPGLALSSGALAHLPRRRRSARPQGQVDAADPR